MIYILFFIKKLIFIKFYPFKKEGCIKLTYRYFYRYNFRKNTKNFAKNAIKRFQFSHYNR